MAGLVFSLLAPYAAVYAVLAAPLFTFLTAIHTQVLRAVLLSVRGVCVFDELKLGVHRFEQELTLGAKEVGKSNN